MTDYLKIYEKFKDIKEVKDYINDVILLRQYYASQQFYKMQEHIQKLMGKYIVETIAWNSTNPDMPQTYAQSYINAENFLQMQGAKIIVEKVKDYYKHLPENEVGFIESMIRLSLSNKGER